MPTPVGVGTACSRDEGTGNIVWDCATWRRLSQSDHRWLVQLVCFMPPGA